MPTKEHIKQFGTKLIPGQKINRLTVISYKEGKWLCLCDCGNYIEKETNSITSGNTKSCGCFSKENSQKLIKTIIKANTKFSPNISSARKIWRYYLSMDKKRMNEDTNLSFEQFYSLTQQNCFYCGINSSNKYNAFLSKKKSSQYAKDNGWFIYNGLDRVDNSKPHNIDNVVPCCHTCNSAKSDRTISEFYNHIDSLRENIDINDFVKPEIIPVPQQKYLTSAINFAYSHYIHNYETMEINVDEFYSYSQCECFYCGIQKLNKKLACDTPIIVYFEYNGIDRIDSKKDHSIDNIVPCCKYCNFAKNKMTFEDFISWIKRIKAYQKSQTNLNNNR